MDRKILLTTVYKQKNYYDYFGSNAQTSIRFISKRKMSWGLRFLKQNIPEIEILEYPTWEEYVERLKEGWDVVGFSFFTNEVPEIIRMAEEARKHKVKELWAGNYGALEKGVQQYFDKIFVGYAEKSLGEILGYKVEDVIHPPLVGILRLGPFSFKYKPFGILFTQRGCPYKCTFCQTPVFCPKPQKISIESIEKVLLWYKNHHIKDLAILDENFGIFPKHTERVVELLGKYGFYWSVMTRADFILKNLNFWLDSGFIAGLIGIESLSPQILQSIGKKESTDVIRECVRKLHERNRYVIGYYMIGFDNENEEVIRESIRRLSWFRIDFNQLCILTPFPETPLWYEIEKKYGIFDRDWHHWDTKHLVWNHPYVTPSKMRELLLWGFKILNPPLRWFEALSRLIRTYLFTPNNILEGLIYLLIEPPLRAIREDEKKRYFLHVDGKQSKLPFSVNPVNKI